MSAEETLNELDEAGLIEAGGTSVRLSDEFRETIEDIRAEEVPNSGANVPFVVNPSHEMESDEGLLVYYRAIFRYMDGFPQEEAIHAAVLLYQLFDREPPRIDGNPEGFFPSHGDLLPVLTRLSRVCIIYAWREDCEPCDVLKNHLESLKDNVPDDISLLGVYGPNWAEFLFKEYDVHGAPTILFIGEGVVDSRLQGVFPKESINTEIMDTYEYIK